MDERTSGEGGQLNAELAEAGAALEAFANGPARAAGEALEQAFAKAGRAIEGELARIARTGEADLTRLAGAIAGALAQMAVGQGGERGAPMNVTMNFSGQTRTPAGVGSANQIAAAIARAAMRGGRFS
jgi:hypothetical protein